MKIEWSLTENTSSGGMESVSIIKFQFDKFFPLKILSDWPVHPVTMSIIALTIRIKVFFIVNRLKDFVDVVYKVNVFKSNNENSSSGFLAQTATSQTGVFGDY
jgi:hypothetical protein